MISSRRSFIKNTATGALSLSFLVGFLKQNILAQSYLKQSIVWLSSDSSLMQLNGFSSTETDDFFKQNIFKLYDNEIIEEFPQKLKEEADIIIIEGQFIPNKKIIEKIYKAKIIILLGNEACFNMYSEQNKNDEFFEQLQYKSINLIRLSGIPVNIKYLFSTLNHIYLYGIPELDELKRPLMIYGNLVCDQCEYRKDLEQQNFVQYLGEKKGCLYLLGCKGQFTYNNCPTTRWEETNQWCVSAGSPCIGCSNKEFPDSFTGGMYSNEYHAGNNKWIIDVAKGAFAVSVGGVAVHAISNRKEKE